MMILLCDQMLNRYRTRRTRRWQQKRHPAHNEEHLQVEDGCHVIMSTALFGQRGCIRWCPWYGLFGAYSRTVISKAFARPLSPGACSQSFFSKLPLGEFSPVNRSCNSTFNRYSSRSYDWYSPQPSIKTQERLHTVNKAKQYNGKKILSSCVLTASNKPDAVATNASEIRRLFGHFTIQQTNHQTDSIDNTPATVPSTVFFAPR